MQLQKRTSLAMAAAAAALLSGCASTASQTADVDAKTEADVGQCYGVNKCKGQGACASKAHACAGQNACKGQGWVTMNRGDCGTKGGRFEEPA